MLFRGRVVAGIILSLISSLTALSQVGVVSSILLGADTSFSVFVEGTADAFNTRRYSDESIFHHNAMYPNTGYEDLWRGVAGVENNLLCRLSNRSGSVVLNPQIEINGRRLVYTIGDFVRQIPLNGLSTVDDTLKALWSYFNEHIYHWTISSNYRSWSIDPVRTLNVFGSGLCGDNAIIMISALRYLGYTQTYRTGLGPFHTTTLLHYGSRVIPIDADVKVMYPKRGSDLLADFSELLFDQDLVRRHHHHGFTRNRFSTDVLMARVYSHRTSMYELDIPKPDSVWLRLRPNESIEYSFNTFPLPYQFYNASTSDFPPPPTSSLGWQRYVPLISDSLLAFAAETTNVRVAERDGRRVIVAVDTQAIASITFDNVNPYAMVSGKLFLGFSKGRPGSELRVSFKKELTDTFRVVYASSSLQMGAVTDSVDFTDAIASQGTPITKNYYVKIEWRGENGDQVSLDLVRLETAFQFNPAMFPRLAVGQNQIRILSGNGQPLNGLVYEHAYRIVDSLAVSPRVIQEVYPLDNSEVNSSQFTFQWSLPSGSQIGNFSDFQLQVSEREDFRFPVSSSFNFFVSQAGLPITPSLSIAMPGLLLPGRTYFWRVIVRSRDGVYGAWSPTWRFRVAVPGIVQNARIERNADSTRLAWDPSTTGTDPAKYLILGDSTRGFSYSSNVVIDSVSVPSYTIVSRFRRLGYPFYRIVPVDQNGGRGEMSELVVVANESKLLYTEPSNILPGDSIDIPFVRITPQDVSGNPDFSERRHIDSVRIGSVILPQGFVRDGDRISGIMSSSSDSVVVISGTTSDSNESFSYSIPIVFNRVSTPLYPQEAAADVAIPVELQWTPNDSATSYQIQISTELGFNSIAIDTTSLLLSVTVNDLAERTRYFWRVRIVNSNRPGKWSSPRSFETGLFIPIPAVADTLITNSQKVLHWRGIAARRSHRVHISSDSAFAVLVADLTRPYDTMWVIPPRTLESGAQYFWRVQALDSLGASKWSIRVPVKTQNSPPLFTLTADSLAQEDISYYSTVHAIDTDSTFFGDVVRYSPDFLPSWLTLDTLTGVVQGTPDDHAVGDTTILISALDGKGGTATSTVHLNVRHTNHSPVIRSVPISVADEDSLYRYQITASDVDSLMFADVLRFVPTAKPSWLLVDTLSGLVTGTPRGNNVGDSVVSVRVHDGKGGEAFQSYTLAVRHTNHPPQILTLPDTVAKEDSLFQYKLYAQDSDSVLFGDRLVYRSIVKPSWLLIDSLTGVIQGTPRITNVQDTTLILRVDDRMGGWAEQSFNLRVRHTNHPPVIQSVPSTLAFEDSLYRYQVVASDIDSSLFGDVLEYSFITKPVWLTIDTLSRLLTGTPRDINVGDTTISVRVYDRRGGEATQSFALAVLHTNHPPRVLSNPDTVAIEDSTYQYRLRAHDVDSLLFGDRLTFNAVVKPSWISIDTLAGIVSGTPGMQNLQDTMVVVRVDDQKGGHAEQSFSLHVRHTNHSPSIPTVSHQLALEDSIYRYRFVALDPDSALGEILRYSLISRPGWLTIDTTTGRAFGIPVGVNVGDTVATLRVRDAAGLLAEQSFGITIQHTNHAPVILSVPRQNGIEDSLYQYTVNASDRDSMLFHDTLRFRLRISPAWLDIDSISGVVQGTPRMHDLADSVVIVQAVDNRGDVAEQRFAIHLDHTNHAPNFVIVADSSHRKQMVSYATEDEPYQLKMYAVDIDSAMFGDVLSYSLLHSPYWVALDSISGRLTGIPGNGDGDTSYCVIASDGRLSDTLNVQLHVTPVDDPPGIAGVPDIVLEEDSSSTISLVPFIHDVDNTVSSLRLSILVLDGVRRRGDVRTDKSLGDASDGDFISTYGESQNSNVVILRRHDSLADSLIVQLDSPRKELRIQSTRNFFCSELPIAIVITDPDGLSGSDTINVEVRPVNDPPRLQGIPQLTMSEDDSLSVNFLSFYPFLVDPDDQDSTHSWFAESGNHCSTVRTSDRMLIRVEKDWFGLDSIRVIVADAAGLRDSCFVHVVVQPVNDAPIVYAFPNFLVDEDSSITIDLNRFVADVDNDSTNIQWSASIADNVERPMHTGKRLPTDGALNVYDGPDTQSQRKIGVYDMAGVRGQLGIGDSITVTIDPTTHIACIRTLNNFYRTNVNLVFTATDIGGLSASNTAPLSVIAVNDRPVLSHISQGFFREDEELVVPYASWYSALSDPDDIDSTHTWNVLGSKNIVAENHERFVRLKDQENWCGVDTLKIVVADRAGAQDTTSWVVNVDCVNDPPSIASTPDTIAFFGTLYRYRVRTVDADSIYNDSHTYILKNSPVWMSIDSLTGSLTGVAPFASTVQTVRITIQVKDAAGDSAVQSFSLRVAPNVGLGLDGQIPVQFELRQNYPNPFNPTTRIIYGVPVDAMVRLEIFDLLGRSVQVVADNYQAAGYYAIEWTGKRDGGEQLSSGMYLYRLHCLSQSGSFLYTSTRKMMFVK